MFRARFAGSTTFTRHASSIPLRKRATFRELLHTTTFKTLALTIVFGGAVTELIARKKQIETMKESHVVKVEVLKNIVEKLKKGGVVDIQKEMQVLSQPDLDIDEGIKEFLSMIEGEETKAPKAQKAPNKEIQKKETREPLSDVSGDGSGKIISSKFL